MYSAAVSAFVKYGAPSYFAVHVTRIDGLWSMQLIKHSVTFRNDAGKLIDEKKSNLKFKLAFESVNAPKLRSDKIIVCETYTSITSTKSAW